MKKQTVNYGSDHKDQFMEMYIPKNPQTTIIVLIHGGFYKQKWKLDLMDPLAMFLYREGFSVANLEYPRYSEEESTNPVLTIESIFRGISKAAEGYEKVFVIGHSAGGHLALLANNADQVMKHFKSDLDFNIRIPHLVISLAGLTDLERAARERLSDEGDAVQNWIGGELDDQLVSALYHHLNPMTYGFAQCDRKFLFIHGLRDEDVPGFYSVLGAPSPVFSFDGVDHLGVIDPGNDAWLKTYEEMLKY